MKKVLLLLATEKGYDVLAHLLKSKWGVSIGGVVSFHEIGVIKDFCDDIENLSRKNGINFYQWNQVKDELETVIKDNDITGVIAISWRYLLPLSLNKILDDKIIVFHDSLLPKYRGFAPVVTAMLCGEKEIGATVLYAQEEVDSGEIILQKTFPITSNMYLEDAVKKMSEVYCELIIDLLSSMQDGTISSHPQNDKNATYSIWRDEEDYWIDWNWSAEKISQFIHSLGNPYKGALSKESNSLIRITKCSLLSQDIDFAIRDVGKIWKIDDGKPVVVCGKGLICIEEAFDENGKKHIFSKVRSRLG